MKKKLTNLEQEQSVLTAKIASGSVHPINRDKALKRLLEVEKELSQLRADPPKQGGISSIGDGSHGSAHQI